MNEIKSRRQIIQVGNSLAVTVPANIARKLNLQKGDEIDVAFRKNVQLDDQFYSSVDHVIEQYGLTLKQLRGDE